MEIIKGYPEIVTILLFASLGYVIYAEWRHRQHLAHDKEREESGERFQRAREALLAYIKINPKKPITDPALQTLLREESDAITHWLTFHPEARDRYVAYLQKLERKLLKPKPSS